MAVFTDSSETSLKAGLLHNGNQKPPIPVGCAVGMKETYERVSHILNAIKSSAFMWRFEGHRALARIAVWIYQVLLFLLCMGSREHHYVGKGWQATEECSWEKWC
jgi:hypothetical protein